MSVEPVRWPISRKCSAPTSAAAFSRYILAIVASHVIGM